MPITSFGAAAAGALAFALAALVSPLSHAQPVRGFAASKPVPDRYIVVFKSGVGNPGAEAAAIARGAGGRLHHVYTSAIKGFSLTLPAQALQGIRHNPNVDYIEQDHTVSVSAAQTPATWGLDRIDQADRPLDTIYNYGYTGAGVHAFILDTGIRADHTEFSGRMLPGMSSIADGNGTNDCHGHGTHVAGTVGGTTYGVAKQVKLVPVRVLDCAGSGSWSGIIAGIDWVANSPMRPAVANMSLGGGYSASVNAAVAGAVAKGVTVAVAAGNDNMDACSYSPASEPSAITVGATTSSDARASYSNWGKCLDLFGPGSNITSAGHTSATATTAMNGTSMATPHVAGVAALGLQADPAATPAAIASWIMANAAPNRLTSIGTGSPNLLAQSFGAGVPTAPARVTIAVKSLAGSTVRNKNKNWKASATIAVRDLGTGAPVANVTVAGTFAPGGSISCVTGSTGSCTVSATYSMGISGATYTVNSLSGTNMVYDASQNAGTQITFTAP
jgi:aqualysin 1